MIATQEVEIVRFDNALLNVHEATVKQDIQVLYDEYPEFMQDWVESVLGIPSYDTAYLAEVLPQFLNDTLYGFKYTNEREKELFADISDLQKELNKGFSRIQYLYPETEKQRSLPFICSSRVSTLLSSSGTSISAWEQICI